MPYLDYIVPGLLASTALQVAIGESTWPVLGDFKWRAPTTRMRATPLRVARHARRRAALRRCSRVALPAAAFLLVMAAFGAVHSLVGARPRCRSRCCSALAVAAPVMRVQRDDRERQLLRAALPVRGDPDDAVRRGLLPGRAAAARRCGWLAYASPLWHGVELCRAATLGVPPPWPAAGAPGLSGRAGRSAAGCLARAARSARRARGLRRPMVTHAVAAPTGVAGAGRRSRGHPRNVAAPALRRTGWWSSPASSSRCSTCSPSASASAALVGDFTLPDGTVGRLRHLRRAGHAGRLGDDRCAGRDHLQLLRQDEVGEALRRDAGHAAAADGDRARRAGLGDAAGLALLGGVPGRSWS